MKTSSGPGRPETSRSRAWGWLTANVALPGLGSIMARRPSGYVQAALSLVGMVLTLYFGTHFIVWYLRNWDRLQSPDADPISTLAEVWGAVKWALLGMALFLFSWLWALGTSVRTLSSSRRTTAPGAPSPSRD